MFVRHIHSYNVNNNYRRKQHSEVFKAELLEDISYTRQSTNKTHFAHDSSVTAVGQ